MSRPSIPPPPAVRWSLQIYTSEPARLPLINSDLSLPHSLVFVGGLTESLGTPYYLDRLAQAIAPYGFSVTQLQLSSSLGGFGTSSLEGDAQEMAMGVKFLRSKGKDKIILMGSSTGCQDIVQYLSFADGREEDDAAVDAAILQAPVSDREHWEATRDKSSTEEVENLKLATQLVQDGKGHELMPRKVKPQLPGASSTAQGNVGTVMDPAMTAYRYWSLYASGADDDFFSTSDFSDDKIRGIWQRASKGLRRSPKGYILALIGSKDETIPQPTITPGGIKQKWEDAVRDATDVRVKFEILSGADHQVTQPDVQIVLAGKIRELIKALGVTPIAAVATTATSTTARKPPGPPPPLAGGAAGAGGIPAWQLAPPEANTADTSAASAPASSVSAAPPAPPSFDALVELIASGRTDEIEGIRDIPLVINEEPPSQSTMDAPRKPWEGGGQ